MTVQTFQARTPSGKIVLIDIITLDSSEYKIEDVS